MKTWLALFICVCAPAFAQDYPARVVGVSDGDTLTVLTAEKRQVKVRVAGIDAPETGQDFEIRMKTVAPRGILPSREKSGHPEPLSQIWKLISTQLTQGIKSAKIEELPISAGAKSCLRCGIFKIG